MKPLVAELLLVPRRRPDLADLDTLDEAGLIALGDEGYHGYDQTQERVITPYRGKNKPESQKERLSTTVSVVHSRPSDRPVLSVACCSIEPGAGGRPISPLVPLPVRRP